MSCPNDWSFVSLNEIAEKEKGAIRRGPFGGSIKKEYFVPSGYKVYEQKNAIESDFDIGSYFIDENKYKELEGFSIKSQDLIISCAGTIGKVAIIPDNAKPGVINQALMRIRPNKDLITPHYLKYYLESPTAKREIFGQVAGTALKNLAAISEIKKSKIPLPPLEEQKRIAAILDKADAIRRKRKKAIRLTEELLRSTFLDMFGDPVTNPKGWETKPLGEFLTTIIDYRGKTPKKSSSGIPLISAANIHDGKVDLSHQQYISERDYAVWTTRGFTKPGDVLITTEAPVGEVAPYPDTGTYQISRRIMALRPNTKLILPSFLLHTMLSKNWLERLRRVTRGSTVPRVLKPDILGQPIPCVSLETQEKFDNFVQRYKKLTQNEESIPQELDNLFNSLLQKAFRGEL